MEQIKSADSNYIQPLVQITRQIHSGKTGQQFKVRISLEIVSRVSHSSVPARQAHGSKAGSSSNPEAESMGEGQDSDQWGLSPGTCVAAMLLRCSSVGVQG